MRTDAATLEGLQMIRDRYWFGMFSSSQHLDIQQENEEYKMRDALYAILNQLELNTPSLFSDELEALEGGSRGGTIPANNPGTLPEIDITKEGL